MQKPNLSQTPPLLVSWYSIVGLLKIYIYNVLYASAIWLSTNSGFAVPKWYLETSTFCLSLASFFLRHSSCEAIAKFCTGSSILEHPFLPWRLAPAHFPFTHLVSVPTLLFGTHISPTNPVPLLEPPRLLMDLIWSSRLAVFHSLKCSHHSWSLYRSRKTWIWHSITVMIPGVQETFKELFYPSRIF